MNAAEECLPKNLHATFIRGLRPACPDGESVAWTNQSGNLVYIHSRQGVRAVISGNACGDSKALSQSYRRIQASTLKPEAASARHDLCTFKRKGHAQICGDCGVSESACGYLRPDAD
jgi:hypothetical protein